MAHDFDDPFARFTALYARASAGAPFDPSAMSLGTCGADGQPSVRIVLLHGFDARGFCFFTNYESRKGADIEANPLAALTFHWPWLREQVRIEGALAKIAPEESDAYFATRERGRQIGAWASAQSRPVASREALMEQVAEVDARFAGREVPRPPHWGGYRLTPQTIEFWIDGAHRLHDRFVYRREGGAWTVTRLSP
jgi:pyridoxamine 5'-phosphate oxidase